MESGQDNKMKSQDNKLPQWRELDPIEKRPLVSLKNVFLMPMLLGLINPSVISQGPILSHDQVMFVGTSPCPVS